MKKILFLVLALCAFSAYSRAQSIDLMTATLQSGAKVSVYYGPDAFVSAYNAAADSGDVITLSAGRFTSVTVKKSLTIVGNGYVDDAENGKYPTIIVGELDFQPRDTIDGDGETISEAVGYDNTRVEGLRVSGSINLRGNRTVNNFSVVKCKCDNDIFLDANTENITIRQSVVNRPYFNSDKVQNNFYIVGSHINDYYNAPNGTTSIDHSILATNVPKGVTFTNSIASGLSGDIVAYNSIFMNDVSSNITGSGNWVDCKYAGIFEEEMTDLKWDGVKTFKLKYPSEYVGTDGTEVGFYGGPYPYNPTPTTPQIKESDIDTTVAEDGVLKVSVTVEAQTEN